MRKKYIITIFAFVVIVAAFAIGKNSCSNNSLTDLDATAEEAPTVKPVGPAFNQDSTMSYIVEQCNFGPRTMNSEAHAKCEKWIVKMFKRYGCSVKTQKADLKGYDGTELNSTNIIASYKPELKKRILVCAHWDSRPWADNDPDSLNWHKPVMAANDAASGVAVMLELARLLQKDSTLKVGVDFLCLDAEDWGTPQWAGVQDDENSWALGAQYFAANLPQGYTAEFGILLDMVGAQGAKFYQEGMSKKYASDIVKKVWRAAGQAGYSSYFPTEDGGMITDDHLPINRTAHVPTIDIIPYYPDCQQSNFGPTWHTVSDDVAHIDKNTLKAVGQTLIQVIFSE